MQKLCIYIILLVSNIGWAQDFKNGQIIDTVYCSSNAFQSYALYLPSNYSEELSWPIIYIFEPAARGNLPLNIFKDSAEKLGFILVCSNNSKNGSWKTVFEAARAMKKDSEKKFNIDKNRIYTSGFSGGSRAAMVMAKSVYKARGIIACAGAYPTNRQYMLRARDTIAYAAIVGYLDMNYLEHKKLSLELKTKEIDNLLVITDSPHQWPSPVVIGIAMEWLELKTNPKLSNHQKSEIDIDFKIFGDSLLLQENLTYQLQMLKYWEDDLGVVFTKSPTDLLMDKKIQKELKMNERIEAKELKEQKEYITAFSSLTKTKFNLSLDSIHTPQWWKSEIDMLQKKTNVKNQYQSYSAMRLLNYVWASFAETSFSAENNGDYIFAVELSKLWQYAQPNSVWAAYNKAKFYALSNQLDLAIEALYLAQELGMTKRNSLIKQPAFNVLMDRKEYAELLTQMVE